MITTRAIVGNGASPAVFFALGPFPTGTILDRCQFSFYQISGGTFLRIALTPAPAASVSDMNAGNLLTDALTELPDDRPVEIFANVVLDHFRFVSFEFTMGPADGFQGFVSALIRSPQPLSLDAEEVPLARDEVPLPPPPPPPPLPTRRRKPTDPAAPRNDQHGKGDIVFVRMVKQALGEFFGPAPGV